MSKQIQELSKPYNPREVEEKIYKLWEKSGAFNPDVTRTYADGTLTYADFPHKSAFSIIMPPPNANGSLHLGHALGVTLQDIMIRYHRMKGEKTLWLPGADHAGFETQVVYDKKLEKEGRSRFQIPRDELYQEMLEFTLKNKKIMENQLRKLGASCDWSREKFTLDKDIVAIVEQTFKKLYDDGLIYRGSRIVNWCVKHQTSLSDLEIKYEERTDPLYYIKYGPLELATVRLETKFGDTAVAVHPKDKRYQKYIGKEIEIETLLGPAKIKVIADETVDPDFGTGAIKVTPAHDPTDFEIWQRHKDEIPLPKQVIDQFGRLNELTGPYKGLKVMEARERIAYDMAQKGLLDPSKTEQDYKHKVAVCYKCGTTIEPMILDNQWFIRMTEKPYPQLQSSKFKVQSLNKSLRDLGLEAVKSGKVKFIPKRFEKIFFHWLKNLRDWNISRQIVWGIRIPAWLCMGCVEVQFHPKIKGNWFIVRHGQTDWNIEGRWQGNENIPLNEVGRYQAKETAQKLKNKNIDLIISSDLLRCKETAEIINKELRVELIFDSRLRERHGGILQGSTLEERKQKFGEEMIKLWRTYEGKPAEGESWQEVEIRISEALKHHKSKHSHNNVVIVTHGGPIRVLRKKIKNLSFENMWQYQTPENAEIIEFAISKEKCKKCGSDFIEQDPDVFDTWFSSGQWPFATLMALSHQGGEKSKIEALLRPPPFNQKEGVVAKATKTQNSKLRKNIFNSTTNDFEEFYPTTVMETGHDILFFWVARMLMLGIYATGKPPFKYVYLHGLVRDKERQKMSKSKGNVIDPLGVIDLYGADALRMALIVGNAPGNDPVIYEEKIRGYQHFANKIWNAARFVLQSGNFQFSIFNFQTNSKSQIPNSKQIILTKKDKKTLKDLDKFTKEITKLMDNFKFYIAAEKLYHYFWHTFADKIIEESKPRLKSEKDRQAAQFILLENLTILLKLLHPFMPFITEKIWSFLPKKDKNQLLIIAPWP